MAFTAKKSDNSVAAVVNDYEAVIVGGLQLIGYGYANYSEEIAQNFIKVAENFAHSVPPEAPMRGQLWYDTTVTLQPCLWVCHNPTGADSPTTARWTKLFTIDAATGTTRVDAYTLRGAAPSATSQAGTVVLRGNDGKIDAASIPPITNVETANKLATTRQFGTGTTLPFDGSQNVPLTTTHISEGSNLYHTTARARGAISMNPSSSAGLTYDSSTGQFLYVAPVGGGGGEGGVAGVATFNGRDGTVVLTSGDITAAGGSLTSHTHNYGIGDISGLQAALDGKLTLASLLTVDGTGSGLDADLLDGQNGSYYLDLANHTGSIPDAAISTGSFIGNGYAKIGQLWLQWGSFYCPYLRDHGATYTVTLPIAFPNAVLRTMLSHASNPDVTNDQADEDFWSYPNGTTTSFTVGADGDGSSCTLNWIAIGW